MRFFPNMTRPDVIFAAIWVMVLVVYIPIPTMITPPLSEGLLATLVFNILSGPVIYWLIKRRIDRQLGKRSDTKSILLTAKAEHVIDRFLKISMAVWVSIFVLNIIASGGLPIVWYLTGDPREYADFGIHTISGFGEMFRCFASTLCILLWLSGRRKIYLVLWFMHFLPSIAMMSRGAMAIFVFQNICAFLMMQKLTGKQMLVSFASLATTLSLFVVLGMLRGIKSQSNWYDGVDQYFGGLPVGFYWIWSYVASPLGNVSYAVSTTLHHDYVPQYTLVYLLPSVFRDALFTGQMYTPLTTDELNATSIYAPLFMDFGLIGAAITVSILITISSYVHVMARRGNLFYIMLYPSLFAALALSFFHIFALTPGVAAVPLLCLWFKRFVIRELQKAEREEIRKGAGNYSIGLPSLPDGLVAGES